VPTTLVLVRHGETDWNRENRFQGHADIPLNEAGRAQARDLVLELANESFQAVYSSPLLRAYETAAILAESLELEVERADDLMEVDVGSWSGLTRVEIEARFPQGFRRWLDYGHGWDDGETYEDMTRRVLTAVLGIATDHPGDTVLVVAHGGPIRALHAVALDMDVAAHRRVRPVEPNARLSRVTVENGRLTVPH
jgi:broad specificity phosphatase PhoE